MTQIQRQAGPEPMGLARHVDNSDITFLDPHRGLVGDRGRVAPIATISLGYKNGRVPVPTRQPDERWLHPKDADNAPQLITALEAGRYRELTISLAGNTWPEFVQQHYALYSETALQVYGDDDCLTFIHRTQAKDQSGELLWDEGRDGKKFPRWDYEHIPVFKAEEPERYARIREQVKSQISIYFYLAEWEPEFDTAAADPSQPVGFNPRIVFDGDVGVYRFRTTSLHTLDNLASVVRDIRKHTGGPVLGVPITLTAAFPQVARPGGIKTVIPVGAFRFQPPFRFTAQAIRPMLSAAVEEGSALALPAVATETIEAEFRESLESGGDVEGEATVTEHDVEMLAQGGRCNAARFTRRYFSIVKGHPPFSTEEGRAELVAQYCRDHRDFNTSSLSVLLERSSNEQALAFIDWVEDRIDPTPEGPEPPSGGPRPSGQEYERLYGQYEEAPAPAPVVPSIRQRATATPEPQEEPRRRTQRQPDGSLVDTTTGEVIEPPPQVERGPAPVIDSDEAGGWIESGFVDPGPSIEAEYTQVAAPNPADAMEQLAADVAAAAPIPPDVEALFPGDPPPDEDERPALTTAVEIWQEATNLGVVTDPPQSGWTDEELTAYARNLQPRMIAAERGRKRRGEASPPGDSPHRAPR